MSRFAKVVAPLMLVLWGLAMVHCNLERLPAFEFLACCDHPDTAPHQDNDCEQDGCATVESGVYKVEDPPVWPLTPVLVLSWVLPPGEEIVPLLLPPGGVVDSAPPELPRIWQFSCRTALPPRAPSLMA